MTQGAKPNPPAYPIESVDNALRLLLMFREQPLLRVAEASRKGCRHLRAPDGAALPGASQGP